MKKWWTFCCAVLLAVIFTVEASAALPEQVLVGGVPFGVKFYSDGIVVIGFREIETADGKRIPAYEAGLRVNDIITKVNGEAVKTSAELMKQIGVGGEVEITYLRNGNEGTVRFTPMCDPADGKHKTGMWVRDTMAGIGTLTLVVPGSGAFLGLGHGICDSDTGELLKMERGTVVDVRISGITKGLPGDPGEIRGYFTSDRSGVLLGNTDCGVYGILTDLPDEIEDSETVAVASRNEVHPGDATIWCTLDDGEPKPYSIRIDDIRRDSTDNRSFSITVTDHDLIEKTGGIIQGMSGSPIMEDGKLIGSVTHVLVNDPTRGYGIFIDNMLEILEPVA